MSGSVRVIRASQEVRLYTDSTEVLKEVAIRPGQGRSAVELIEGVAMPRNVSPASHIIPLPAKARSDAGTRDQQRFRF